MKTYEVTFFKKYTIELDDNSTEFDALEEADTRMDAEIDSGWPFPFDVDIKVFPLN
jgi:hypothetical protein